MGHLFKGNTEDNQMASFTHRYGVFIVKFEKILHIVLVIPLLIFNASKCQMGSRQKSRVGTK